MNKVIIIIEGGLVQEVVTDGDIKAYILDRDTNGQSEGVYMIDERTCFIHQPNVTKNREFVERTSQQINSISNLSNKAVYKLCGADVMCVLNDMGIAMSPEQLEDLTEYLIRKLDIPWAEYIQSTIEYYLHQKKCIGEIMVRNPSCN